jgi:hypothetical protein
MYGARSGMVIRRVSSLASPRLASKAVVRELPAKLKPYGCRKTVIERIKSQLLNRLSRKQILRTL